LTTGLAFVALAAIWGSSFLFIRIAAPEFGAVLSAELRVGIAWVCLWVVSLFTLGSAQCFQRPRLEPRVLVLGLTNSAIPFALYGAASFHLSAGYLAILNALVPLWAGLIASVWLGQPFRWSLVLAVALAATGIAMLVNLGPVEASLQTVWAGLACAAATFCYALAAQWTRRWFADTSPLRVARSTLGYATLALLPFAIPDLLTAQPSAAGWFSVFMLGLLGSGLAYLLYFWLLRELCPVRAVSVTFLIPGFGILWGAVFLDEVITLSVIAGLGLVVLSSLLVQRSVAGPQGLGTKASKQSKAS
jgi:drug/metabolite transporter (DMT)-like permease